MENNRQKSTFFNIKILAVVFSCVLGAIMIAVSPALLKGNAAAPLLLQTTADNTADSNTIVQPPQEESYFYFKGTGSYNVVIGESGLSERLMIHNYTILNAWVTGDAVIVKHEPFAIDAVSAGESTVYVKAKANGEEPQTKSVVFYVTDNTKEIEDAGEEKESEYGIGISDEGSNEGDNESSDEGNDEGIDDGIGDGNNNIDGEKGVDSGNQNDDSTNNNLPVPDKKPEPVYTLEIKEVHVPKVIFQLAIELDGEVTLDSDISIRLTDSWTAFAVLQSVSTDDNKCIIDLTAFGYFEIELYTNYNGALVYFTLTSDMLF